MRLAAGSRLGAYEIVSPLGAGGMGEVYRARDPKLNRDVAIKVLPDAFANDAERLARFTREAQTLAALNHPNIAHIYGLEKGVGTYFPAETGPPEKYVPTPFLVMELVEGEDLGLRIARGPMPPDDALPIARQIAEALEAAHDQGIIHRDLKPANVKVRADGVVKVLDFGLAKAMDPAQGSGLGAQDVMMSPTLTARATQLGVILGTAAYMAPEQARGKAVDKRADIWAFGAVVYEMLTGRRAFAGDDITDVLASVLRQDIDWTALPAHTPRRVRRLLERCLDRDPKKRLRDIGEARVVLDATEESGAAEAPHATPAPTTATARRQARLWPAVAASCLLAGLLLGALMAPRGRDASLVPVERAARAMVVPTPERVLDEGQAISPDGRWIAYTAAGSLWIRNLSELDPQEVKASKGARRPFWSPASDAVAYAAGDALFKVSTSGGTPVELCKITGGDFTGGSWSASQGIVFTSSRANWDGEVMRVAAEGGTPEVFTRADARKGERRLADPHFLPDGRSLLYTATTVRANDGEVMVDRDGVRTPLGVGNGSAEAVWSRTGHVIFTRFTGIDTALWALPLSVETMTATGEAFRVAAGGAGASIADDETLVYALRRPNSPALVRVDRAGGSPAVIAESRSIISEPRISPDGRLVTGTVNFARISVWDTARGVETLVTGEDEGGLHSTWLPGNPLEVAYTRLGKAGGIVARRPDGSGGARQLLEGEEIGTDFSNDGKRVAYYVVDPNTGRDLWAKEMDPPGDPFVLLRTKTNEARPRISPDGKYVAYQADASGRWEIYVMPFPPAEGRIQVSTGGGQHAVWNPKGGELFYVSGDDLMAVDITLQPTLQAGQPRRLFGGSDVGTRLTRARYLEAFYDAMPDGRGFLVVRANGTGTSDVVVSDGVLSKAAGAGRR